MILFLNTAILALTLISPFVAVYAVRFIKKGNIQKHIKIQKILFWTCMLALVALETQIRMTGGSGSIVKQSSYYGTTIFKVILISHIIGAVLTYIIWGVSLFITSYKYRTNKSLSPKFSKTHKKLGYFIIFGLFYTAITALIVYIMTFVS